MSNNAKNLPEVKLGQYKGLAVTRHVRPLSEKTIDQEMVHQTRMRSVYRPRQARQPGPAGFCRLHGRGGDS